MGEGGRRPGEGFGLGCGSTMMPRLRRYAEKSQRDFIIQPGVARNELRRVMTIKNQNPNGVSSNGRRKDSTPSELMKWFGTSTQRSAGAQHWAELFNPFGIAGKSRTTKPRPARQEHSLSGNAQTSRRRLAMTRQAMGEISMPIPRADFQGDGGRLTFREKPVGLTSL